MPTKLELIEQETERRAERRSKRKRPRPQTGTRAAEARLQQTRRHYEGRRAPKVSVTIKKK